MPNKFNDEIQREFVEKGAELEHDRWARWQKYMFSKFEKDSNGNLIVPKEYVERWFRQIDTPYSELPEQEKESDRQETRNYLPLIETLLSSQKQEYTNKLKDKIEGLKHGILFDNDGKDISWVQNQIIDTVLSILSNESEVNKSK
jgi:hypothetical protein